MNYPINMFGSEAFRSVMYLFTVWGLPSWIEVSDSFYQELVMLVQIVSVFISSFLLCSEDPRGFYIQEALNLEP